MEVHVVPVSRLAPDLRPQMAQVAARYYRDSPRAKAESPFVLRELKQGRFCESEVARIRAFEGESPILRFRIDCIGADEIIVFHRFSA